MTRLTGSFSPARLALCSACLLTVAPASRAEDLAPPPWPRLGAPNYTVALEWEFFTDSSPSPHAADGIEVTAIEGDGFAVPEPSGMLPAGNVSWLNYGGDGGWIGGVGGGILNFRVSNWIDDEPLKIARVQITYDPGAVGINPYVDLVLGFDMDDPDPVETFISATDGPIAGDPEGRWHRLEQWEITPNPDFETIQILVPEGVTVDQVVIDTISLPEPSSLALLGLGLLTLGRRRR